jgi:hypothetical protein
MLITSLLNWLTYFPVESPASLETSLSALRRQKHPLRALRRGRRTGEGPARRWAAVASHAGASGRLARDFEPADSRALSHPRIPCNRCFLRDWTEGREADEEEHGGQLHVFGSRCGGVRLMIGHDKRFVTTVGASLYGEAVCTCVSPAIKYQPRELRLHYEYTQHVSSTAVKTIHREQRAWGSGVCARARALC